MFRLFLTLLALIPVCAHAGAVMDRVNKTQTIRCGYVSYDPALVKDDKTHAFRGFDYDIVKAVGARLQLGVDYAVPTGWATVVSDLNASKFDVLCSGFWVHPNVGRFALFSRPAFFQPVFVVARAGEKRFTKNSQLNNPSLKMVALDGDNPVAIAKADFPAVKVLTLPNGTDFSQVLVNVAYGKADFTIVDAATFGAYNEHNPGKLKIISLANPIRVYPVSYVFGANEYLLRDAFNNALDELILDGTIDRILTRHIKYPRAYYRAVVPFK